MNLVNIFKDDIDYWIQSIDSILRNNFDNLCRENLIKCKKLTACLFSYNKDNIFGLKKFLSKNGYLFESIICLDKSSEKNFSSNNVDIIFKQVDRCEISNGSFIVGFLNISNGLGNNSYLIIASEKPDNTDYIISETSSSVASSIIYSSK